jgi:hypothetical protein
MPSGSDEQPTKVGVEEADIDQILADSFPASDAPPWTLGVSGGATYERPHRKKHAGDRR